MDVLLDDTKATLCVFRPVHVRSVLFCLPTSVMVFWSVPLLE